MLFRARFANGLLWTIKAGDNYGNILDRSLCLPDPDAVLDSPTLYDRCNIVHGVSHIHLFPDL